MKYFWFICIPVLFIFPCCGKKDYSNAEYSQQVRGAPVLSREITGEVRGFGSLSFLKKVDVAAPADAVLENLYSREGDTVKEGQLIAVLGNPQISLAARRAESAYAHALAARDLALARLKEAEFSAEARILENEKAEAELVQSRRALAEQWRKHATEEEIFIAGGTTEESIKDSRFRMESAEVQIGLMEKELEIRRIGLRTEDLRASGIEIPGDEILLRRALINLAAAGFRAEARAAEANLEAAGRELESSRLLESSLMVYSPMTGIVGARYLETGERVKREDRILTLMDTQSLYAVFQAPEIEALKLSKGMAARVSLDGTGGSYDGIVDLVSPQADSQSFSFLVRVILPADKEGLLKPGMFSRIVIPLEQSRRITVIPENSLVEKKNDQGKVFTIRGDYLSLRMVRLGQNFGDEREILSGLSSGEVVVLKPDAALQDGSYVSLAN